MINGRYESKDLVISANGETQEKVIEKIKKELEWVNNYYGYKKYPSKPRLSSIYFTTFE